MLQIMNILMILRNLTELYIDNNLLDALPGILLKIGSLERVHRHGNHNYFKATFMWYHTDVNDRILECPGLTSPVSSSPRRLQHLAAISLIESRFNFYQSHKIPSRIKDYISFLCENLEVKHFRWMLEFDYFVFSCVQTVQEHIPSLPQASRCSPSRILILATLVFPSNTGPAVYTVLEKWRYLPGNDQSKPSILMCWPILFQERTAEPGWGSGQRVWEIRERESEQTETKSENIVLHQSRDQGQWGLEQLEQWWPQVRVSVISQQWTGAPEQQWAQQCELWNTLVDYISMFCDRYQLDQLLHNLIFHPLNHHCRGQCPGEQCLVRLGHGGVRTSCCYQTSAGEVMSN